MDKRYIRLGDELLEVAFMDTVDKLYVRKESLASLMSNNDELEELKAKINNLEERVRELESSNTKYKV